MTGLLIAGMTSDAGKSILTTGLCRAFARRGIRVAPYKAQNMSNNSMLCRAPDGTVAEIGRAQWIQALAAGAAPEPAMNPILLKPGGDRRSHVISMGRPAGELSARDFTAGRGRLAATAHAAYDDLAERYDLIIAEGAGSPAEINLRASDYVNLGLARHAELPTLVVGDIDRGGWFAAAYGTLALLEPADQRLIAGWVVNKFRGEVDLLRPGLDDLEHRTGRPTYGVLPWHPDLWLDSEDTLDLEGRRTLEEAGAKRVAVIRLPRISNVTDVDALRLEPDLDVVFVSDPRGLCDADLVVLPGTRATLADLTWLRERGLADAITAHAAAGGAVHGICGGAQMLGRTVADPDGIEGAPGAHADGLGLLDLATTFGSEKRLVLHDPGYEIHHGRVTGRTSAGSVTGTMVHGRWEDDGIRSAYLRDTLAVTSTASFPAARERRLDLLADLVTEHLDLDAVLELAHHGCPDDLPVVGG